MFMEIAIGAIGVAIVLMVGFVIVSQVRLALPSGTTVQVKNPCYHNPIQDTATCNVSTYTVAGETYTGPISDNTSLMLTLTNGGYGTGTMSAQTTVFAGFGLLAVGIIVLAAFGLINVFS